ncbi:hypothetical protein L226DRAFT_473626 [Lentinus tigrinus ALCF2SS1-7]|uniref:Uncharacterized protein n=1 Tax=Lentinus tigrinus ALCF2SS1-6 TaxID=1328759 RepID=A0A5C2RRZ3_9APHY|nr:hypothetical protein L227DRAFT_513618 [Lentinus tigrinus ALCF2SS1-6]RPD68318.1 hypothetical protein L226DRAFT_473626 [Lentinus tigrinus ALCF2SS1-7]
MPHLKDDLDTLLMDPTALAVYGKYITNRASAARGDDIGNLNKLIMKLVAPVPELAKWPGGVPHHVAKTDRGWISPIFGLLLCPQDRVERYMADPEKFCLDVRTNIEIVTADDFPMFLYDQNQVQGDDPLAGLLRGVLLLMIFKALFTGPSSALSGIEDKTSGRAPWAVTYKMTRVEPRHIVYAAVLARHILSSQSAWSRKDINFVMPVFYKRLVDCFKIPSFSQDILAWYDMQVFGTARTQSGAQDTQPRADSIAGKIAARIAAQSESA